MSFKLGFLTIQNNFFSGRKEYLVGEKKQFKICHYQDFLKIYHLP
jgi:hypothetical protein